MNVYGYARVSTKEQNLDRQIDALAEEGITGSAVFQDKQSGKDFDRPSYKALMNTVQEGDLIVIKSIDRLGRNYEEILEHWRIITKEKHVNIKVLDMPLLDTSNKTNDITGVFITDLVLQLLAYFAQSEREAIRRRQKEGIAAAKNRGVRFGRPAEPKPEGFEEVLELWKTQKISAREAGRRIGVSHKTFLSWAKKYL